MREVISTVIDTNALLSAVLYPNSMPQQALSKVLETGILLFSQSTANEFREVLLRPKFDKYLSKAQRENVISAILSLAHFVDVTITITDCRDPKDNKFLEVAVTAKANFIIKVTKICLF